MPIYDFRCGRCDALSERITPMSQKTAVCDCGGRMNRVISSGYGINAGTFDYVEENLGANPVRITGREHLERVMREQKVSARSPKGKEWW